MFKTGPEAVETARALVELTDTATSPEVMIAPPFTALALVAEALRTSRIRLGAQNLFWEKEGAFTGEISAGMLRSAGCSHVIIGHSERRQYFGERDQTVNQKLRTALAAGLTPVVCVGESEREREAGEAFTVLGRQLQKGLEGFTSDELGELVIAYEPVWAIGTGKTASAEQAQEAHAFLRSVLEKSFGIVLAKAVRILYGGSVKSDNISGLMALPDVDGALVGGASLKAETFSRIIHYQA